MPAVDITPAGLLIGFFVAVAVAALVWAVLAWRSRAGRDDVDGDGPVIDLAYLERAIKADEEAAAQRVAQDRPLFSQAPAAEPERVRRLPTDDR